jgi:alpha-D-xyloside xylohydrolase
MKKSKLGLFRTPAAAASLSLLTGLFGSIQGRAQISDAVTREDNRVIVKTTKDVVRVEVCNDANLHISAASSLEALHHNSPAPWIVSDCNDEAFSLTQDHGNTIVKTAKIEVRIAMESGKLGFFDAAGNSLLTELTERSYAPVLGEQYFRIEDNFQLDEDEAVYGLGQHQAGPLNYRGSSVYLSQRNTDVSIPVFVSTRGYGLLWNTASSTVWDNRWAQLLTLTTTAAKTVDYYFLYGPEPDQIVHQYRTLTGHAPLYGKWAYGLFQSKDHYLSQEELLQIDKEYRDQHIPLDTIVQDWFWWKTKGSSQFNANYPDFAGTVDKLHRDHFHAMISIWPNFDADAPIVEKMKGHNWLLPGTFVYDATNPEAQDLYWKELAGPLLAQGIDAFWLDASEPEQGNWESGIKPDSHIHFGDGALYTNVYPYAHAAGIYRNWRATTDRKRAFILTRSAFLGSQSRAAATWSGDVYSTFRSLGHQVSAGLNFSISGLPYWTTDTGGYGYPSFKSTEDPEFREVFTRWLEYSAFCPLFRIHGQRTDNRNEIYSYGPNTPILVQFDRLRYRMLPYIYSAAWKVTDEDYTMMRPLVMDWRTDRNVWEIGDEFMFGPGLLVAPVTHAHATSRSVYLPHSATWYDFWTGHQATPGQIESNAPLDRIPIYVRAGSIVPLGPEIEYSSQKTDGPIELRIYRGADGHFDLYDDEGDGYSYEKGAHAVIPIDWNETTGTLTLGERLGSYPGMPQSFRINVVFVRPNQGVGELVSIDADREIVYAGKALQIRASKGK